MRHESKAMMREELQRLTAAYAGPIHHDADRLTLSCPVCHNRRYVTMAHVAQFGLRCLRCGSRMRMG
jgi:hypothetical protein